MSRLRLGFPFALTAFAFAAACSSSTDAPDVDAVVDAGGLAHDGRDPGDAADAGEPPPYDFTVVCAKEPCVKQIAARGGGHVCARVSDGAVYCWGSNDSGQLGTGSTDAGRMPAFAAAPRRVGGIAGAIDVSAAGRGHAGTTCVVAADGVVSCFGSNASGQLGQATPLEGPQPEPKPIAELRADAVVLSDTFALAVDEGARLWTWGSDESFQLARVATSPDAGSPSAPRRADRVSGSVRSCAGTSKNGFVVTPEGELLSWGAGTTSQLGRTSSLRQDPNPGPVAIGGASSVVTGAVHVCALSKGAVHCWGRNAEGQLGTGVQAESLLPARVLFPQGVYPVAIAAGGDDTCALDAAGAVYCWGANGVGQVGAPVGVDQASPRRIALEQQAVAVAVMDEAICALLRSGAVACWGDNLVGQLGRGARDGELHLDPAPVVFE